MFAHYFVKISNQSNAISIVFQRIRNSYYTNCSREIMHLTIKKCKYVFSMKNYDLFYKKLKYNLTKTNKYNIDKKFNYFNNSK